MNNGKHAENRGLTLIIPPWPPTPRGGAACYEKGCIVFPNVCTLVPYANCNTGHAAHRAFDPASAAHGVGGVLDALEKEMLRCKSEDYTARGVQPNLR